MSHIFIRVSQVSFFAAHMIESFRKFTLVWLSFYAVSHVDSGDGLEDVSDLKSSKAKVVINIDAKCSLSIVAFLFNSFLM